MNLRYDPAGNRIWKCSTDVSGNTYRKYIVDTVGDLPVILMELDPCDSDAIIKTYVYANSQPIMQYDGDMEDDRYFYLHDRLGNVRALVDIIGDIQNRYTYEPYGNDLTAETEETVNNSFKFTGQYYDEEIAQYYLRARQYDVYAARFSTRDPAVGEFKEPLTLHRYLYCLNDPINNTDPKGEFLGLLGGQGLMGRMRAGTAAFGAKAWAFAGKIYTAVFYRSVQINMFMHGLSKGEKYLQRLPILGYTRHGLNSAISHDGVGVSPRAILNAVANPSQVIQQANGTIKYIGENAVVVLNEVGQVVTTWATSSTAWR